MIQKFWILVGSEAVFAFLPPFVPSAALPSLLRFLPSFLTFSVTTVKPSSYAANVDTYVPAASVMPSFLPSMPPSLSDSRL